MKNEKIKIRLEDGSTVDAQAPLIISASRATDIPAFYCQWFFNRLKTGYVKWRNPYNGKDSYVSFMRTKFIVFWSKNPAPLLPFIPILKEMGIGCYFQYTLNDYDPESLEPNVPPLTDRIKTFKRLVDNLGIGSVVWRYDPLILTDKITINDLLTKIKHISEQIHGYTQKLVFSFADISSYRNVGRNLNNAGIYYREWTHSDMIDFSRNLKELNLGIELATCAEKIDLTEYGISHNCCIDPKLICAIMPELAAQINNLKVDTGQRALCKCIKSKDIGTYNTCPHGCTYCYANTSAYSAHQNFIKHQQYPDKHSIL